MQTKTYFFNETKSKIKSNELYRNAPTSLKKHIDTIIKMKSGNKIGYFQFNHDGVYYKLYIMPKIYNIKEGECTDCQEYKKNFINFFKHYYRLVSKYEIEKYTDELDGNISDLVFKSNKDKNTFSYESINDIDDFIVHNYQNSLKILESFFTKHKSQRYIKETFKSQSLKNKLDIKQNLLSLDKSYIHQTKHKPMIYSIIALITKVILKNFLDKKIRNFSNSNKALVLRKDVNKLLIFLRKKFSNENNTFNIKDLLSRKTSKLFEKNNEHKLVYKALLKLTGKEHYYNGDIFQELFKEDETISLFFHPEKLYEWIVYDNLVESNIFDEVLKDGKDKTKMKYTLNPSLNNNKYSSEPDIVVKQNNQIYPIDAKWKILNTKDSSFDNDISKLRRDAKIRKSNKGYLIYPMKYKDSKFNLNIEYHYDFEDDFKFELNIINV